MTPTVTMKILIEIVIMPHLAHTAYRTYTTTRSEAVSKNPLDR
jgi:hypothetical protein